MMKPFQSYLLVVSFLIIGQSVVCQEFQSIHLGQLEMPINSRFGEAVSLFEREAAIAAPGEDIMGRFQGAVYIFRFDGSIWTQVQKITASDGSIFDFFGTSVSLYSGVLAVGVPHRSYFGGTYIYEKIEGEYQEMAILDPAFSDENFHPMDFGLSVGTNGEYVAVGAPAYQLNDSITTGAVFIYEKTADTWEFTELLLAEKANHLAQFGQCLSMKGNRLIVGAPGMDTEVESSGSAFIYEVSNGSWNLETELHSTDHAQYAHFGSSVDIDGIQAVVGIKTYARDTLGATGGAEIFIRPDAEWVSETIITASDSKNLDYFGHDVQIEQNLVVVSAIRADIDSMVDVGAIYIFAREANEWIEKEKYLIEENLQSHAYLGNAIDVNDEHLLVGAHLENNTKNDNGNAYVLLLGDLISSVNSAIPQLELVHMYPNPFHSQTAISFQMVESTWVKVDVLDVNGNLIAHLMNQYLIQGSNEIIDWKPRASLSEGMYLIRIESGGKQAVLRAMYFGL